MATEDVKVRSPNRKPRWRKAAQMMSVAKRRKVFLEQIMAGDSLQLAAKVINTPWETVSTWMKTNQEFKEAYHAALTRAEDIAAGNLRGMLPKAVDVVNEGLNAGKLELRVDTALKVLKGRGLLPDKTALEHTGPGGGPMEFTLNIGKRREGPDESS